MKRYDDFPEAVRRKVETLVCHLHAYGSGDNHWGVDLSDEDWATVRLFAAFLFQEARDDAARVAHTS